MKQQQRKTADQEQKKTFSTAILNRNSTVAFCFVSLFVKQPAGLTNHVVTRPRYKRGSNTEKRGQMQECVGELRLKLQPLAPNEGKKVPFITYRFYFKYELLWKYFTLERSLRNVS